MEMSFVGEKDGTQHIISRYTYAHCHRLGLCFQLFYDQSVQNKGGKGG